MYVNPYAFNLEDAAESLMFSIRASSPNKTATLLAVNEIATRFGWDDATTHRVCDYLVAEELLRRVDLHTVTLTHSGSAWLHMARLARTDTRLQSTDPTPPALAIRER